MSAGDTMQPDPETKRGKGGAAYIAEQLWPLAVPIDTLTPDPANARKHGEKNMAAIRASLSRFGQRAPIVVQRQGMVIRAGNGRWLAAKAMGWTQIAAVVVDDSSIDAVAFAIADNRTSELAEWDTEVLASLLNTMPEEDMAATGFDEADLNELLSELTPDVVEDEAPEAKPNPVSKTGDLWELGEHRLLCGDSTSADDVKRLMGGVKADMCFTSPPYNSKDGGYKTDYNGKTKKFYNHNCDDRTEEEWVVFCNSVLGLVAEHLSSDEAPVVWNVMYTANCRAGYGKTMFCGSHGLSVKETICWDKGAGFPTASRGILSRNWELVFVLSLGSKYKTTQGENEPRWAKWDIARPQQQEEHKATFPVELASRAMSDFGEERGTVYEPFCGSGTTLIAAEQLGRKCYGMEISPQYCDVIVTRWEKLTGKKATCNGKTIEQLAEERGVVV